MRSILILNAKGGSGKTTIATNLAGYYATEGANVALADFDPQGSSIDWLRQRSDKFLRIAGIEAFAGGARVPRRTDVMIMDAPAKTHDEQLADLVKRAQTIIIPVVPSPVDIRAAGRFFAELRNLRSAITTNVKMATVATRVREGSHVANDLDDYLYNLKLPSGRRFPFITLLRMSTNYLRAADRGLSIFEFAPLATAVDREFWMPLLRWLSSSRSMPNGVTWARPTT